jgi:hypothetical protein
MKHTWAAIVLTVASATGTVLADGGESQGAIARATVIKANISEAPRAYSFGTGSSEVLATNFVIQKNACISFDSSQDFMGADTVAIALVAVNADIRQTQVIPLFGISQAPYMFASGKVLQGDSFYPFPDVGSGTVPVLGNLLSVRICNNSSGTIRYTQLTLYVPHR